MENGSQGPAALEQGTCGQILGLAFDMIAINASIVNLTGMTPPDSFLLRPASIHFHQIVRCMLQLEFLCFRTAQSKGGRVAGCSDGGAFWR